MKLIHSENKHNIHIIEIKLYYSNKVQFERDDTLFLLLIQTKIENIQV